MDSTSTTEPYTQVLDTAADLFYAHGVQAVGMDRIRDVSGVSLKRLYRCFPSKEALVGAYLHRCDQRARAGMADYVAARSTPEDQLLALFDWQYAWFREPDCRGCAFIHACGQLGGDSVTVDDAVRDHKTAVRTYLLELARATSIADPDTVARQLELLFEGAMGVAAV